MFWHARHGLVIMRSPYFQTLTFKVDTIKSNSLSSFINWPEFQECEVLIQVDLEDTSLQIRCRKLIQYPNSTHSHISHKSINSLHDSSQLPFKMPVREKAFKLQHSFTNCLQDYYIYLGRQEQISFSWTLLMSSWPSWKVHKNDLQGTGILLYQFNLLPVSIVHTGSLPT